MQITNKKCESPNIILKTEQRRLYTHNGVDEYHMTYIAYYNY